MGYSSLARVLSAAEVSTKQGIIRILAAAGWNRIRMHSCPATCGHAGTCIDISRQGRATGGGGPGDIWWEAGACRVVCRRLVRFVCRCSVHQLVFTVLELFSSTTEVTLFNS
jgi:hypothetical protein